MKTAFTLLFTFGILVAQQPDGAAVNPPWNPAATIRLDDLVKVVGKKGAPPMIHVGFDRFYNSKHIPGSIYAGPGRTDEGLALLKKAVANYPKDSEIVLYCGCCPWDHCPNMKPAYRVLREMGFSKITVVEVPTTFEKEWIEKGYPVEGATATHGN